MREAGQWPAAESGPPSKDSQLARAEALLTDGQLSAAAALVRSVVGGPPVCLRLSLSVGAVMSVSLLGIFELPSAPHIAC